MPDDLRTRIAAAILRDKIGRCQLHSYEAYLLADAVIRELDLHDLCRGGCMWQIPRHVEDMTPQQRELLKKG